ncbi:MAG: GGDEF domain-containing protein [Treponema sp.]|nr:GGDEF domain-containing protein [Treponema sp.]
MRDTKRIAFITDYMESEYSQKLCAGASKFAKEHNLEMVSFSINQINSTDFSFEYQALSIASHIRSENFDGVLFATGTQLCHTSVDYLKSFIKSFEPLPVVSIGDIVSGIPSVLSSSEVGFSNLVSHLIEKHGCRRIALMSVKANSSDVEERTRIFKQVLLSHNIAYDESMILFGGYSYEIAFKALSAYTEAKGRIDFDAVVALNDQMAYGCIDYFLQHKLRVPEDVLVTGFDDEERSLLMTPSLTSMNQELMQQGYKSTETLLEMIEGHKVQEVLKIPATAAFRQSCGCVPKNGASLLTLDENGMPIVTNPHMSIMTASDWCMKRAQFTQIVQIYTQMQTDMSLNEFRVHINTALMSVGILSGAVILFESPIATDRFEFFPLPQKALVYTALDRFSGFWLGDKEKPIPFNPRKGMIPEGIFSSMSGMQVCALYHTATLYGYIIFLPGNYDMAIYSMFIKMFSNSLATAYRISQSAAEKKILEQEYDMATKISVTDELTGLLNRRGFMEYGQRMLKLSKSQGKSGMVIFGDIDGLKKINDTYGHSSGDIAIQAEASILKRTFRHNDIIGRIGGDEFAIIAPELSDKDLIILRQKLVEMCSDWSRDSDQEYEISISLGATQYNPDEEIDLQELLDKADEHLYEEKQQKHSAQSKKQA